MSMSIFYNMCTLNGPEFSKRMLLAEMMYCLVQNTAGRSQADRVMLHCDFSSTSPHLQYHLR